MATAFKVNGLQGAFRGWWLWGGCPLEGLGAEAHTHPWPPVFSGRGRSLRFLGPAHQPADRSAVFSGACARDLRRILIDCDKAIHPVPPPPPDQMQGSAMRWVMGDCTPHPALHAAFMPRSPWPRFSACQGTEPSNKFMKSLVICNSCAPLQVRRTS